MATVSQSGYYNLQALTSLGALGVGMRLYFYATGTTTKKDIYTDAAGATPHTLTSDGAGGEYVALDARGELTAPIYMTSGAYDVVLKTSAGATVWTRRADPTGADLAASGGSAAIGFLQSGTGAVARTAQAKMRESVSVLDFGATGDGVTDDTAAIQLAIDSRKSLHWPPGEFIITDELTFPATTVPGGGWWKGGGMSRTNPQVSTRDGPTTTLIWDGAVGGTMISSAGLAGWAFEDMAFVGRPASGDANRAGILLHFKTNASFGTGHNEINRCSFWDADVCVQEGVLTTDTDCDTTNLRQVIFGNSDRGFVNKHGQGLLHYFNQVFGLTCTTVIDFEQGGDIQCDSMNFNGCGGAGATDYAIRMQTMQTQSHTAIFNNLRVENGTVKALEAKEYGKVVVNAYTEGQVDQNSLMFYSEGAIIEFNACRFATFDATTPPFKMTQHAGGFRPAMVFRECTFEATTFTLAEWFTLTSTSLLGLRIENCTYKGNGTRLPAMNSVLEWGPVTHHGQTTNATLTNIYLFGTTNAAAFNARIPSDSAWQIDAYVVARKTPTATSTVTISNATPGVVSWAAHGLANDDPVYFTTTGGLPTGLSPSTMYYIRNQAAGTFEVSATAGGASIATSSAGSGVHTAVHTHEMSFQRRVTVQDTGGVSLRVGAAETIGTDINPRAVAGPVVNVQNGFIRTQVTGLASTTFNWRVVYRATPLIVDVA